eukprot:superscaffoldBa00000276_g3410
MKPEHSSIPSPPYIPKGMPAARLSKDTPGTHIRTKYCSLRTAAGILQCPSPQPDLHSIPVKLFAITRNSASPALAVTCNAISPKLPPSSNISSTKPGSKRHVLSLTHAYTPLQHKLSEAPYLISPCIHLRSLPLKLNTQRW